MNANARSSLPKILFYSSKVTQAAKRKLLFLCFLFAGLSLASVVLAEEAPEIEQIVCEGNRKATCGFILSQTSLREGEKIEDEKLKDARLKLELTGFFEEVDLRLSKGSQPGKAKVTVSVQERSSYSFSLSAGIPQVDKPISGIIDMMGTDRNFSGRGDSLSLRFRSYYSNMKDGGYPYRYWGNSFRLEYIRPDFLLPKMYAMAALSGSAATIQKRTFAKVWTGDFSLGYRLFDYSFIAVGYRYTDESYLMQQRYIVQNPYIRLGWDSQDNPDFPTQGSRLLLREDWRIVKSLRERESRTYGSFSGSYLQHWSLAAGNVLSLRIGAFANREYDFFVPEDEAFSLRYTKIFHRGQGSEIKKAAYYIEPGVFTGFGKDIYGARLGANLQTSFGVVNLFLLGGKQ